MLGKYLSHIRIFISPANYFPWREEQFDSGRVQEFARKRILNLASKLNIALPLCREPV
jgi:hypothetical protein